MICGILKKTSDMEKLEVELWRRGVVSLHCITPYKGIFTPDMRVSCLPENIEISDLVSPAKAVPYTVVDDPIYRNGVFYETCPDR